VCWSCGTELRIADVAVSIAPMFQISAQVSCVTAGNGFLPSMLLGKPKSKHQHFTGLSKLDLCHKWGRVQSIILRLVRVSRGSSLYLGRRSRWDIIDEQESSSKPKLLSSSKGPRNSDSILRRTLKTNISEKERPLEVQSTCFRRQLI
jgi:hypothetical protein